MFFKPLELPGSDLSGKAKSFTPDKFFQQVLAKLSCIKTSSLEFKCSLLFVAYLFIRLHSVGMALLLRNLVTYNLSKKSTFLEEPYFFANKLSYKDLPFKYVLENEELFFKTFDKLVFFVDIVENKKLIISPSELFDWIPPLLLYKCFCQDKPKIGNFD